MAKKKGKDAYMEIMGKGIQRRLDNPKHCRLCGKELIPLSDYDPETWNWIQKNECHPECARRKMHELREEAMRKKGGK